MIDSRKTTFARFAWFVLAYDLFVILWGAFVRASGSGAGCGSHWPACNGEILHRPESIETMIELTHRVTSGLSLLLTVAVLVGALRLWTSPHRVRQAAGASMFFMVTEAALGAGIVLLEYVADDASVGRAWWMALHLVNTFMLVAAAALTAWFATDREERPFDVDGGLRALLTIGALALLVTGAAGAVTALGDTLFPARSLAEGMAEDLSPTAHFLVRLRVIHPIVATVTALYLAMAAGMVSNQRPTTRVRRAAIAVGVLTGIQIAAGLLNLALLAPVWMQLVHLLLADLVWIAFVLLGAIACSAPRAATGRVN